MLGFFLRLFFFILYMLGASFVFDIHFIQTVCVFFHGLDWLNLLIVLNLVFNKEKKAKINKPAKTFN